MDIATEKIIINCIKIGLLSVTKRFKKVEKPRFFLLMQNPHSTDVFFSFLKHFWNEMKQQDVNNVNGIGNEKSMSEIIFPAILVVRNNLKARTQRFINIWIHEG